MSTASLIREAFINFVASGNFAGVLIDDGLSWEHRLYYDQLELIGQLRLVPVAV